jgi:DNA-directed RNA polymerase subunit beta'
VLFDLPQKKPKAAISREFDMVRISLASPDKIREWSWGEVTKPETINYRTFKPEKDGLFCARIFGPVNDWECLCGKYKRMKHRGVICEKCGVEVTLSKVRRERMGHIELATPVSHVWFFKGLPSRIGHLLEISLRNLERILYFEAYVVIDPGDTELIEKQIVTEEEYRALLEEYPEPEAFIAKMGAEAIKDLLQRIEIDELNVELRAQMKAANSQQKRQKYAKRLKVVQAFRNSDNKPEWMILDVIPVIPPELRPLVPLDGGRFATSDLNDLYRRVINRNNRLKKLMELKAPSVIVRNEKRMLQEAVDALFDNGRRGRVLRGANNRPLKSLSDTLKGKHGRFRQNLLGKRVDYSGRSVIVVGPDLELNQCGLPKKMALELFKPFIYHKLEQRGFVQTIKAAKEMVESEVDEVWDILEEVIQEHPVMLNRAPTLHRLGIQAFQPMLIEGKAIKIHPLVCTAFNADFDGDQMAVHLPLSPIAQMEARVLMMSSENILSPASGGPIATPSQDIVLGSYYLTKYVPGRKGDGRTFASIEDVLMAHSAGEVTTPARVYLRYTGKLIDLIKNENQDVVHSKVIDVENVMLATTAGRCIFNDAMPKEIPFVNGVLKKKGLQNLVHWSILNVGNDPTVKLLDKMKNLGFEYATRAGISIGLQDMVIPDEKEAIIAEAKLEVRKVEDQYQEGTITDGERYNRVIAIWSEVTDNVSDTMFSGMESSNKAGIINPIFVMADSGARGSKQQIRQLAGMRGLMAKPRGDIIETPITSNFREGLTVLQYFISTHGARKGLADTALKTADSGYLTRRLVDVSQDVIVTANDCGTLKGKKVEAIIDSGEVIEGLYDRIIGRVALDDISDPISGEVIIPGNHEITNALAEKVEEAGIHEIHIRSVLTCETDRGICHQCYGRNLATGNLVEMGEACGVIAAQSIGEPGTQLTMRTFHIGGAATAGTEEHTGAARNNGKVQYMELSTVKLEDKTFTVLRKGELAIIDEEGREIDRFSVQSGANVKYRNGAKVKKGDIVIEWDPYSETIISEYNGIAKYDNIIPKEEVDERTGLVTRIVDENPDYHVQSQILVTNEKGKSLRDYSMPFKAHLLVEDGAEVKAGAILAKIPKGTTKTKDITGGLPRVVELFEARKPKAPAVMTEIDGLVRYGEMKKGYREIIVEAQDGDQRTYQVPRGVHIKVREEDKVRAGDALIDGPMNPHDILDVLGEEALQDYLVNEVQEVYRLQGVVINDKHIEVIIRQMMRWVRIEEVGDTTFLIEQQVDKFRFQRENDRVAAEGGTPARGKPVLLGITKASLSIDSWISAASFQETTRVLTEASISGSIDYLRGLKENVIVGRLIPAGTGMDYYRDVKLHEEPKAEESVEDIFERGLEEIKNAGDLFGLPTPKADDK